MPVAVWDGSKLPLVPLVRSAYDAGMRIGGRLLAGHVAARRTASVVGVVVVALLGVGCSSDAPAVERAGPSSSTTDASAVSTTTSATDDGLEATSTTSTTLAAHDFEPLLADPAQTPEQQVEAAYLYHWEVLSYAGRTGDTSVLPLVFADEALELRTREVEELFARNIRMEGHVEHDYAISAIDETHALVTDGYRDFLAHHDATTGQLLGTNTGEIRLFDFEFEKRGGSWLVVNVLRLLLE